MHTHFTISATDFLRVMSPLRGRPVTCKKKVVGNITSTEKIDINTYKVKCYIKPEHEDFVMGQVIGCAFQGVSGPGMLRTKVDPPAPPVQECQDDLVGRLHKAMAKPIGLIDTEKLTMGVNGPPPTAAAGTQSFHYPAPPTKEPVRVYWKESGAVFVVWISGGTKTWTNPSLEQATCDFRLDNLHLATEGVDFVFVETTHTPPGSPMTATPAPPRVSRPKPAFTVPASGIEVNAKFIIVEPQEVVLRTTRSRDLATGETIEEPAGMSKPWRARPEGCLHPWAEGDTAEEALDNLREQNLHYDGLETMPHVVLGETVIKPVARSAPPITPQNGGSLRVDRSIDL